MKWESTLKKSVLLYFIITSNFDTISQSVYSDSKTSLWKQPPHIGLKAARCEAAVFAGYSKTLPITIVKDYYFIIRTSIMKLCFDRWGVLLGTSSKPLCVQYLPWNQFACSMTCHKSCWGAFYQWHLLSGQEGESTLSLSQKRDKFSDNNNNHTVQYTHNKIMVYILK